MEKIIETRLNMYIEPRRDIAQLLHIDAYLTSDLSSIVVDYFQYMDEFRRYDRRLRFSFAHEVGHLELHRDIYDNFTIADPKEYYDFITNVPEADYRAFEFQANEFAGRLLVPKNILEEMIEIICAGTRGHDEAEIMIADKKLFIDRAAPILCKPFGVSEEVIIRRVLEEDLYDMIK